MTIQQSREIHDLIIDDKWVEASNKALGLIGKPPTTKSKVEAIAVLRNLLQFLLDGERYLHAATLQWGGDVFLAEPESVRRSFMAMEKSNLVLMMGASSVGKCLHPETKVLMHNGTTKQARFVRVGDRLMGDDSQPRNVLVTSQGRSEMFKITPERGEPWICNDAHILSLRTSTTKICGNSKKPSNKTRKGLVVDIPIRDYLAMAPSRKSILKQFHVGVEFPEQPLEFDPYVYGSWIGDGGTDVPALHTPPGPMAERWCEYFKSVGFRIHVGFVDSSCPMWCARWPESSRVIPNPFLRFIRSSVIKDKKEKFIREEFLVNSRKNRLMLLAGLIDSDGYASGTSYQFTTKFKALADQVTWLARSLGLAAVSRPKVHTIKSIGFAAIYHTVQISGSGVSDIPCLEKPIKESCCNKNLTNTGFSVKSIGVGDYCGFVIDGNHRFLLGDFTVTHNTYGIGAWMLLDYLRDPLYTSVKLAAVSEDHLRKNLFAHVSNLFRNCAIPNKYKIEVRDSDLWLGVKEAGYEFGISGIAFKQSQETSGQFKGHKFKPVRKKKHPQFGYFSRLRVLLDEGQNVPGGPFQDFNSLIASMDRDRVKIAVAFNPENTSCLAVQMAEPEQGWLAEEMETLYDYEAKSGWTVCRLDAARSENVIQKKVVFEGLQTYEGFLKYLKSGGDGSAAYSCFARGWPPMKGSIYTMIPPAWPQQARGEAIFIDNPIILGSVDLAFMGKDTAQMAVARWGMASGWRDHMNKYHPFVDRLNIKVERPHHVLQIDQILPLEKHDDTVKMAEEIIGRCNMLKIPPGHLVVDKTSIGLGTHSHLNAVWGSSHGISWNEGATERKIMAEDQVGADEQCEGVVSEMWWTFRRWMDPVARAVLINPIVSHHLINTQLTSRRYKNTKGGRIKVESKEEYKARNAGDSPDEADAVIMLPFLVRLIGDVLPGLVEQQAKKVGNAAQDFVTVKRSKDLYVGVEKDDSLCDDGPEVDAPLNA